MATGYLSDLVTWLVMSDNAVVFNNNHTLQKSFVFEGQDTSTMTEEEVSTYVHKINNAIKRLGSGFVINFETQKQPDDYYLPYTHQNELQEQFDESRKHRLSGVNANYNNYQVKHYLTIVYRQPPEVFTRLNNVIDADNKTVLKTFKSLGKDFLNVFNPTSSIDDVEATIGDYRESLDKLEEDFLDNVDEIIAILQGAFKSIRALDKQETLTYLHSTISDHWHKIETPIDSMISQRLSDSTFLTGRHPKLGDYHIGSVCIKELPEEVTNDILNQLNSFNSSYRYCVRYIALSKEEAKSEILKMAKRHKQAAKPLLTQAWESITNKESNKVDEAFILNSEEAQQAAIELESGNVGFGYLSITVTLLNKDKDTLEEDLKKLRSLINGKYFTAFIERDNAPEAWLGTIPSCWNYNIRRFLQHSLALVAVAPVSSLWEGIKENSRLDAPALLKAKTPENLPFYLTTHVGDSGHIFVAGATGAGKSVFLNTLAAHYLKYENARVYIFDKAASSRVLTEAVGGNFYNLLVDTHSIAFQPLARIDHPNEQEWALEWLLRYADSSDFRIDKVDENLMSDALKTMAEQPVEDRTLTTLSLLVQSEKWRLLLSNLLMESTTGRTGLYGRLFDSNVDKFGSGSWQAFEMEQIMQNESIVGLTLDYLFHRIDQSFDGKSPTLIIMDECWLFLRNKQFRDKIFGYIKDLRKKNASVIMATQNLSDVSDDMLPAVTENIPTKIFLPNQSTNDFTRLMYKKFGLNDTEIDQITKLKPKEQYFYKSPLGTRVFSLDILDKGKPTVESIFFTSTDIKDQRLAAQIAEEVNHNPDLFREKWKALKGVQ